MTDEDGDGVFEREIEIPVGNVEFKYTLCNEPESEMFSGGESCTNQTGTYINRRLEGGVADIILDAVCFQSSGACAGRAVEPYVNQLQRCAGEPGLTPVIQATERGLYQGESLLHWKGVAWNPYGVNEGPGANPPPWRDAVDQDTELMVSAGIDTVRTYGVIPDREVLDTLHARGIGVLMTVFYGYGDTPTTAVSNVCSLKDHPAIIGWLVGNEWNYNNLGRNVGFDEAADAVEQVVRAIKLNDNTRPVSTVYGGLPEMGLLACMSEVDVWGLNVYTGASFGSLFEQWAARSQKPMYFGEYGADAFDTRIGAENETYQADIVGTLTSEIHAHSVRVGGVCTGGMVFEFSDEWWKFSGGSWGGHDTQSSWENGAYADAGMQEEWWGLVRMDRTPRDALTRYGTLQPPTVP